MWQDELTAKKLFYMLNALFNGTPLSETAVCA